MSIAPSFFIAIWVGGSTPISSSVIRFGAYSSRLRAPPLNSLRQGRHSGRARLASGLFLVVSDIEATRADLASRGVDVSEIFHIAGPGHPPMPGLDPERRSYVSHATFKDPDGNTWLLQEVIARFPGRLDPNTTSYASEADLATAMRRASEAHGEHEKRNGGYGTRTGRTGMPHTWWLSRPARSCHCRQRLRPSSLCGSNRRHREPGLSQMLEERPGAARADRSCDVGLASTEASWWTRAKLPKWIDHLRRRHLAQPAPGSAAGLRNGGDRGGRLQ